MSLVRIEPVDTSSEATSLPIELLMSAPVRREMFFRGENTVCRFGHQWE